MNTHAKKHAFNYILDSIDGDGYGVELTTDKQKIDFVYETFKSEYSYTIEHFKRAGISETRVFADYLAGLPSCINIEFRNYYILEMAKQWGSIPENATEKQQDKIIFNWFNYIAISFFQLRAKLSLKENLSNKYNLETV
jgi:hypothetical protein